MKTPEKPKVSRIVYVILAVIGLFIFSIPGLIGNAVANKLLDLERANCELIEEGLGQIGPNQENPQTAEKCIAVVNQAAPIYKIFAIGFSYMVAGVFAAFAYAGWLIIRGRFKK